ncbi:MAG: oligoendopeptidase F [Clostridia bacterium]|nr:oligoendopeptidase F [Clostridia bacterium]
MADNRLNVDEKHKWKLEDIYASDEDFEAELMQLEEMLKDIPGIRETLTDSPETLAKAFRQTEAMEHIAARLFVYARMRRDEDNTVAKYQAMTQQAIDINVKLASALAFMNPALLKLKKKTLKEYIDAGHLAAQDHPEETKEWKKLKKHGFTKHSLEVFKDFDFNLEELLRSKPHVLSTKEERLLAMAGEITGAPKDIFTMLNNADLNFGTIQNEYGQEAKLTQGNYILFMQSIHREVRQRAYDKLYDTYKEFINTISTTYAASVRKDSFIARATKFPHAIERALFSDNVPVRLYDNLISIIHENLDIMYRYVALRKQVLGVDQLHMYDVYVPLVPGQTRHYSYDEAVKLVKEGLGPLGDEYQKLLNQAVSDRWIDVEETPGKTSGAYSWGVYGVHPYVLLNHRGDLDSVFTIAHELGHAMHTYFSNLYQPEAKADYAIFVAEVASTVNEILLTKHLLSTVTDRDERLHVLNHYLDQFRTTVVRQTMFAEFEQMTHADSENGLPLTYETLSEMYGDLNALYYGPEMARDDRIIYEWARIPHFYTAFYVYKYATGFSCAVQIANDICSGRKGAVEDYLKFLSSGGSNYPLELLKIAGVHLADGEPIRACMKEFSETLTSFKDLLLG